MTAALCTGCGKIKFGALLRCACGTPATGMPSLDIFLSDHYLDANALAFLGTVITRIRRVAPEPDRAQGLFFYFASKNLPGLMKIDVDAAQRSEMESLLKTAGMPAIPDGLVFRFDTPIAKRKKSWWKFVLSLGAVFGMRKRQALSPEMRGVFDRLLGGPLAAVEPPRSVPKWKPRPFHENVSKEDVAEWFANAAPWSRVDPRVVQALIGRLYGNPMFELFVLASQNCEVIPKYVALRSLFDKGLGDVAACPRIAEILIVAGARHGAAFAELLRSRKVEGREFERHYRNALDASEAAVHLEPNCLLGYLQLARLKQAAGKSEDAIVFCNQGLAQVEQVKKHPLPRRPEMNLMGAVEEVECQLRSVLRECSRK